jgi:nucleoside-diphosphate-sugar epimerase
MNVVITGAAGFLGRRLAARILERGRLPDPGGQPRSIDRLTLVDVAAPDVPRDPRVRALTGDIADPALVQALVDERTTTVFHLAAIVSGMAESDFDLGMRVNLDATRLLLDTCRARGTCPRFVFTSSVAVYGGELPDPVLDATALVPQSSYGTQKAIAELLINDYSRRGFVDGRSLRLPTISVRPGRPNAALSSFASGIIREPLAGVEAVCPVDPVARLWLMSPSTVMDCLLAAQALPSSALGVQRSLNLPGLTVSVGEMVAALERVAGAEVVRLIRWEPDPRVQRMVATWPGACDATRARALGFPADRNFDDIIRQHQAERDGQ